MSAQGKALLNATLTEYGDSIIQSPIVIEGYWNGEAASDQLRVSRSRALLVRQYVQMHFQLDAANLGVVPMRNAPPTGMGRSLWDGICIVLLRKS